MIKFHVMVCQTFVKSLDLDFVSNFAILVKSVCRA